MIRNNTAATATTTYSHTEDVLEEGVLLGGCVPSGNVGVGVGRGEEVEGGRVGGVDVG